MLHQEFVAALQQQLTLSKDDTDIITDLAKDFSEHALSEILGYLEQITPKNPMLLNSILEAFKFIPPNSIQEFVNLVQTSLEQNKLSEEQLKFLIDKFTVTVESKDNINPIELKKEYGFLKFCINKQLIEEDDIDELYAQINGLDASNLTIELERMYTSTIPDGLSTADTESSFSSLEEESSLRKYLVSREQLPTKTLDPFDIKVLAETDTPLTTDEIQKIKIFFKIPGRDKLPRTRNKDGSLRTPSRDSKLPTDYYLKLEQHLGFPLYYSVINTPEDKLFIIYPGTTTINRSKVNAKTLLGKGSLGRVKLIQDLESAQFAAIKIQTKHIETLQDLLSHEKIMLKLTEQLIADKRIGDKDYTLMNYIQGIPLHDYLQDPHISTTLKLQAILAALEALKKLHNKNIFHGDLNLSNIIIAINDRSQILGATLIDYAFALSLDPDTKTATITQNISYRNKDYLAPEYIAKKPVTPATDLFTLGIWFKLFSQTKDIKPAQLAELFSKMCNPEPKRRPSINECIKFINNQLIEQSRENPTLFTSVAKIKGKTKGKLTKTYNPKYAHTFIDKKSFDKISRKKEFPSSSSQ